MIVAGVVGAGLYIVMEILPAVSYTHLGPCNTVEELMKDEQVADRGMMITVGGETQIGIPAKFSGADDLDNICLLYTSSINLKLLYHLKGKMSRG